MEKHVKKRKDVSLTMISLVVALILSIGAGLFVYFKNQSHKKHPEANKTSYLKFEGTKIKTELLTIRSYNQTAFN